MMSLDFTDAIRKRGRSGMQSGYTGVTGQSATSTEMRRIRPSSHANWQDMLRLEKQKKKFKAAQEVLAMMKGRNTKTNIKCIKEEIKNIDIATGVSKNLSSVTQILHECRELANNLKGYSAKDETTKGHRLLNAYIHSYKDMLSLNHFDGNPAAANQDQQEGGLSSLKEPFTITIDFTEYNAMNMAAKGTGYDAFRQAAKFKEFMDDHKESLR
mmetsp:Transcript_39105/g.59647  ORF Transcript_39105/g.59647 Transcript_39105/m.59647 type:complete len:213 (+) Transcript_39105:574-1212(+)